MKRRTWIGLLGVLICTLLSGCAGNMDGGKGADGIANMDVEQEEGELQIVWLLPEIFEGEGLDLHEEALNQKLKEDGYRFSVTFRYRDNLTYQSSLSQWLEEETDIDIVNLGSVSANEWGYAPEVIRAGYLEELSGYFESGDGKRIWDNFYSEQWETVRTDGGIYTIPSQYLPDGRMFIFNSKYITEADVEGFDGSIGSFTHLPEILSGIRFEESDTPVMFGFSWENIASMGGCDYRNGVFISLETGQVYNPFETELLRDFMMTMHILYEQGYIEGDVDLLYGMPNVIEVEAAANLSFGVWQCYYPTSIPEEIMDNIIMVHNPTYFQNKLNMTTGISSRSRHKQAAMTLLSLLYTDAEYANLLIYGEEGIDYQLIDGIAESISGERLRVFSKLLYTGLYYDVYPYEEDSYGPNRRDYMHELYESDAQMDSILLGFQENTAVMREAGLPTEADLQEIMYEYINLWKEDDIDAALAEAAEAYRAAGGDLLVEEYQRQISAWMGE